MNDTVSPALAVRCAAESRRMMRRHALAWRTSRRTGDLHMAILLREDVAYYRRVIARALADAELAREIAGELASRDQAAQNGATRHTSEAAR